MTDIDENSAAVDETAEPGSRRLGRRAVMLGATAAGVGAVLSVAAKPDRADAADGNDVILGSEGQAASSTTGVTTTSGYGLSGTNTTGGTGAAGVYGELAAASGLAGDYAAGVVGDSSGSSGVLGLSKTSSGVHGVSMGGYGVRGIGGGRFGAGVYGSGDGTYGMGVYGTGRRVGVFATGSGADIGYGFGVYGAATSSGYGVYGTAKGDGSSAVYGSGDAGAVGVSGYSVSGTGVSASSDGGDALQVHGVACFSRSGSATVAGTASKAAQSVEVTGVVLTHSSMVLATPQGKASGVEGVVTDVSNNSFTIYLTKAINVSLDVAWFVIDLLPPEAGPSKPRNRPPAPELP
jgi:hypothetical protein